MRVHRVGRAPAIAALSVALAAVAGTASASTLAAPHKAVTSPAASAAVQYEAENATISQGVVETIHTGYSGTGYVNGDNLVGSYIEWTVNAASAGPATVGIRYANGASTDRPADIAVNGTVADPALSFPSTGSWNTWATTTITVSLNAGANKIRLTGTTANGPANIDYVNVTASAGSGGLNPGVAPGGNFNLSKWELQLPTGSTNATTTISPARLEGPNGYQDKYFYTDPTDGSMTFWDPENGVTLGSNYPRTELREMNSSGAPTEWSIPGTHTLSATLKATQVPDHVTVGQIHLDNSSGSSKPLLELFYYHSGEIAMFIEQSPAGGNGIPYPITTVPLGTKWSYVIGLTGGNQISLVINGTTKRTWTMPSAFNGYKMYFKAGDYDQSVGSSSTVGAKVQFYALTYFHGA